jgi:hypothetical protein
VKGARKHQRKNTLQLKTLPIIKKTAALLARQMKRCRINVMLNSRNGILQLKLLAENNTAQQRVFVKNVR